VIIPGLNQPMPLIYFHCSSWRLSDFVVLAEQQWPGIKLSEITIKLNTDKEITLLPARKYREQHPEMFKGMEKFYED